MITSITMRKDILQIIDYYIVYDLGKCVKKAIFLCWVVYYYKNYYSNIDLLGEQKYVLRNHSSIR